MGRITEETVGRRLNIWMEVTLTILTAIIKAQCLMLVINKFIRQIYDAGLRRVTIDALEMLNTERWLDEMLTIALRPDPAFFHSYTTQDVSHAFVVDDISVMTAAEAHALILSMDIEPEWQTDMTVNRSRERRDKYNAWLETPVPEGWSDDPWLGRRRDFKYFPLVIYVVKEISFVHAMLRSMSQGQVEVELDFGPRSWKKWFPDMVKKGVESPADIISVPPEVIAVHAKEAKEEPDNDI